MIVIGDTSALFAAFDAGQPEHVDAAALLESESFVISALVLTELDHLVRRDFGYRAAVDSLQALSDRIADGRYRLANVTNADLAAAQQVRHAYASLELDLADAVCVVLADRHRTNRIFTLDQRDFRAIAPLTRGFAAFTLLPADR